MYSIVGDEMGLLREIHIHPSKEIIDIRKYNNKSTYIQKSCWIDKQTEEEIIIGQKDGTLEVWDLSKKVKILEIKEKLSIKKDIEFVGLNTYNIDTDRYIAYARKNGMATIFPYKYENMLEEQDIDTIDTKIQWKLGNNIETFNISCDNTIAISGGKETLFCVWDITTQRSIFTASREPPDYLGIDIPYWDKCMCFLESCNKSKQPTVIVGTNYGKVQIYDTRVSSIPTIQYNLNEKESIFGAPRSMVMYANTNLFVGTSTGYVLGFDIRKNLNNFFKLSKDDGAIRNLSIHQKLPLLCSVGLSRYMNIYNIFTKVRLSHIYMKYYGTTCNFSSKGSVDSSFEL